MKKEFNPFISIGYKGPHYFCDRKKESQQLTQFMLNSVNVTLFAIRRMGKTALIHHVFNPYRNSRKLACIYVDILSTNNLSEFTNNLATAVYNRFPTQNTLGKKIMNLFQRFRPVISFDALTGTPTVNLTIDTQDQKEKTIGYILNFLDQQNIQVVFAIDEFQQILEYPEKNTEAILRTYIQQLKNTSFIFCGSNQKMMHEIFNSAKRPFFASCTNMSLNYIDEVAYRKFILDKFKENKKRITDDCIDFICSWTKLHTFFVQQLCFTLYAQNKQDNTLEGVRQAAQSILKLNEPTFYQYRNLLTVAQWRLLGAIAKQERVTQPLAKQFITDYQLGTPALVKRGLEALLKKELIFYNTGVKVPYYEVYDKFLMRWLQSH